jgi:uncharacterized membrane protein YfcA
MQRLETWALLTLDTVTVEVCGLFPTQHLPKGSIGFGLGLIGAPLLALIDARLVPGPLLSAAAVLTLLLTRRDWHGISFPDLRWSLSGYVVGILVAAAVVIALPPDRLSLTFGAVVILAVVLTASGLHLAPGPKVLVGAGVLSGFMGTTASIGGPAIALVYQRASGPRIRGTLSAYFVIGILLSISGLTLIGRFGRIELVLALSLIPGVLVGFALSHRTARLLDRGYMRVGVLVVSAAAGTVVILKHLL